MRYRDIVECIKVNQIKQGISVKTLASRVGVSSQAITNIRGYRLKVSTTLFSKILRELSVTDVSEEEISRLLQGQLVAKTNNHKYYMRKKRTCSYAI